jgi:phosphomannomutase
MDTSFYRSGSLPTNVTAAFKEGDIRGIYGSEIDQIATYRIVVAFITHCKVTKLVVARDMRVSSPAMHTACIAAARDMGVAIIDIGLATTPTMYYVAATESVFGVMITASHNPAMYNGLKFVLPGAIPLTRKTGLDAMLRLVKKNNFTYPRAKGVVQKKNVARAYQRYVREMARVPKSLKAQIVVDIGNGMAGTVTPILKNFKSLGVHELFAEPDGTFPNRESNPNSAKNQKHIRAALQSNNYDFGVAFDGDADRIAFFDEKGNHINAATIGALLASRFLATQPHSRFVYTVLTSRVYYDAVMAAHGKPLRARVGHAFIKEQMRKHDAVFGCEHSAHFYFKDHFFTDSGILTLLYVLAVFHEREAGQAFSDLVAPYQTYTQTENKDVVVPDREQAMAAIEVWAKMQTDVTITHFDGVTIRTPDWWCVVNKDVAMPTLNVMVESPTKRLAVAKQKEIISFLKQYPYAHS